MTSDVPRMGMITEDPLESLEISPPSDSEPQSLMGVRFACNTLENAMPMIMQEVLLKKNIIDMGTESIYKKINPSFSVLTLSVKVNLGFFRLCLY